MADIGISERALRVGFQSFQELAKPNEVGLPGCSHHEPIVAAARGAKSGFPLTNKIVHLFVGAAVMPQLTFPPTCLWHPAETATPASFDRSPDAEHEYRPNNQCVVFL